MPNNRKYFLNNTAFLVTSRTEEGLPFVASLLMNVIIWGIIARARRMYQVKVCHFIFMANHFHMLLVVENPQHVSAFVGYVKGETAHAVNLLLGRQKKTIWADGYDSPMLLTAKDVMHYIVYIYINPAKANLVKAIGDFPGVSSWDMFFRDEHRRDCRLIWRTRIPLLATPALSINEEKRIVELLFKEVKASCEFVLEPFAWMSCFPEFIGRSQAEVKEELLAMIDQEQQHYEAERQAEGKTVMGATALRRESMLKPYQPGKFSERMICICWNKEYRKAFISYFRSLCHEAREVYEEWKSGDLTRRIPPGLFPPHMPILCSQLGPIA